MQARRVPAEHAVLLVVRDRTDELQARGQAEREFVSNAAHELRNPLAGISERDRGAAERRQGRPRGARPLPDRLAERRRADDRLTQSLLTLARVEAVGAGETEVVDVSLAIRDVVAAVETPKRTSISWSRSSPIWSPRATRSCSAR